MLTVITQARSIREFQARIGPWHQQATVPFDPAITRELQAVSKSDGTINAFTLESIGQVGDQLLAVSIHFDSGDASYLWRLTPAQ